MNLALGANYFVRSHGTDYVGELVSVDGPTTVTLRLASWVAESGRLSAFVRDGRSPEMEIEPVGDVMLHWSAIVAWPHPLFPHPV